MALALFSRKRNAAPKAETRRASDGARLSTDPFERAFQLRRLGVILAEPARWQSHPRFQEIVEESQSLLDDQFGLTPDGFATIPLNVNDEPGCSEEDHEIAAYLLQRMAVSNSDFYQFVADGGYENTDHWPQEIWPHLIEFKDLTGRFGPRFWRDGRYDRDKSEHPVVGICYYEAMAYAHWCGYRLPTEAEWQMAATWRIRSSAHISRRYPWGDVFDLAHCNIWATRVGSTAPVGSFACGAAPNGVLQLIGNVWEWTATDFTAIHDDGRPVVGEMLMKAIRGGAFDTYFPWQATSTFRSGMACLARGNNVGFRCAMSLPQA